MALTIQFTVDSKGDNLTLRVIPLQTCAELPSPIEMALALAMKEAAVDIFKKITNGVLGAVDTVCLSGTAAMEAAELHERNKQHPQQEQVPNHDINVKVTL